MIYANGQDMAVSMGDHDNVHLFRGAMVQGLSWSMEMSGVASINIGLVVPMQRSMTIPYEMARSIFASANQLSVEELLAAVYKKMEERG
jgi:hypothetical protein